MMEANNTFGMQAQASLSADLLPDANHSREKEI